MKYKEFLKNLVGCDYLVIKKNDEEFIVVYRFPKMSVYKVEKDIIFKVKENVCDKETFRVKSILRRI